MVAHGCERFRFAQALGERLWLFNSLSITLAGPLIDLGHLDEAWDCLERALQISGQSGGSLESDVRARRAAILLARGHLDEAAVEAARVDSASGPHPEIAELRAAQGRHAEAEEIWQRLLEWSAGSEERLDRAETEVGYAGFLTGRGRLDEARAHLDQARDLVAGTGARFHQRLIRQADAFLN